jgi:hypothetical protein
VTAAHRLIDVVRHCVDRISNSASTIAEEAERLVGSKPAELDLRVVGFLGELPVLLEQGTGTRFRFTSGEFSMTAPKKR